MLPAYLRRTEWQAKVQARAIAEAVGELFTGERVQGRVATPGTTQTTGTMGVTTSGRTFKRVSLGEMMSNMGKA